MKFSRYMLPTLRESPAEAELTSHKLMLQAGMIRKVASGVYEYLPLGFKVLKKIEEIVREEMNRSGGQEIRLPIIQPASLWRETGRWEDFGPEMFKLKDRKDQSFTLGPTHEEVITDLIRREIDSYKDMPLLLYQINDKYRDEIRPRYGVMRSREFLMKDGYSFHADQESLEDTYQEMYDCYGRIFDRCGLDWEAVEAPTGLMGGSFSQEFMALASEGGEELALCPRCDYAANINIAEAATATGGGERESPKNLEKVSTPDQETVSEVAQFLNVEEAKIAKTFLFRVDGDYIATLVRGDRDLEENKLYAHLETANAEMISESDEIQDLTGAHFGSVGPIGLEMPVIADRELRNWNNLVTGANEDGHHYINVNLTRDLDQLEFADIRRVEQGDPCPDCGEALAFQRGIEVGQIFQLGTKYSESLNADYQDQEGNLNPIVMGCYGIGISRIISAVIEQYHDERGIKWPIQLAPFQVEVIVLQGETKKALQRGEEIYTKLTESGVDTLLDDRDVSAGVKFNDSDLIGIPVKLIIGPQGMKKGVLEIETREGAKTELSLDQGSDEILHSVRDILHSAIDSSS
ncbi:MAG: proline--tRNA ligase [Candidatus Acetothermia bacterium]